jgi:Na+/H+ antiporter NhaC
MTLHECKVAFPYVLTFLSLLILTVFSVMFMMSNRIDDLRTWLARALTDTFIVLCIGTFSLIIASDGGTMNFKEDFLEWLGAATIAEVAGIVLIVFRFFFKATEAPGAVQPKNSG